MGGIGIGVGVKLRTAGVSGTPAAWTPVSLDAGVGKEVWFANSYLPTIGDAQPIANWRNEFNPGSRDAVQASGPNQPTVVLNADGFYEVKGDGADDYMDAALGSTIAQPTTVWAVGSIGALGGINRHLFDGDNTTNRQTVFANNGTSSFAYNAGSTVDDGAVDISLQSFVAIFNGASSALRIDGSQVVAGNPGAKGIAALRLFASTAPNGFNAGVIRDVGLCSSVLAGDDLTNLESYLATLVP